VLRNTYWQKKKAFEKKKKGRRLKATKEAFTKISNLINIPN